jgi:hypothetical protein
LRDRLQPGRSPATLNEADMRAMHARLRPQDPPETSRETRGPAERGGQTAAQSRSTSLMADRLAQEANSVSGAQRFILPLQTMTFLTDQALATLR